MDNMKYYLEKQYDCLHFKNTRPQITHAHLKLKRRKDGV